MLQLTYLFLGAVAFIVTVLTLTTADDQTAILTGIMGAVSWLLWAYSSLNIVVVDGGGADVAHQYPSLAAFGVVMAIPNLFVALTGPLQIARDPRGLAEQEVRN